MKMMTPLSLALSTMLLTPNANASAPVCDPTAQPPDPLIIDLDGNGFHFGAKGAGVAFDILGNGQPLLMQWVKLGEKDAFLAFDRNRNGIVDNGSELFGNGTALELENFVYAANGFAALLQYDRPELGGNNDGLINAKDGIWTDLSLWLDTNADGVSTADEMHLLGQYAIQSIIALPRKNDRRDSAGNWMPFWNWSRSTTQKYKMVNVFFKPLG